MDKLEKDLHFFHALPLLELKGRCSNIGDQILVHLAKLYLFRNSQTVNHWISEIIAFIVPLSRKSLKGGKFNYSYFFNEYKPYTLKNVDSYIRDAAYSESELKPESYSWRSVAKFFEDFEKELKNHSNNSKRILVEKELQIILQNLIQEIREN